jgi:hypothetical protein
MNSISEPKEVYSLLVWIREFPSYTSMTWGRSCNCSDFTAWVHAERVGWVDISSSAARVGTTLRDARASDRSALRRLPVGDGPPRPACSVDSYRRCVNFASLAANKIQALLVTSSHLENSTLLQQQSKIISYNSSGSLFSTFFMWAKCALMLCTCFL